VLPDVVRSDDDKTRLFWCVRGVASGTRPTLVCDLDNRALLKDGRIYITTTDNEQVTAEQASGEIILLVLAALFYNRAVVSFL